MSLHRFNWRVFQQNRPIADVGAVYFNVCFEEVKRKSSRSLVTSAWVSLTDIATRGAKDVRVRNANAASSGQMRITVS